MQLTEISSILKTELHETTCVKIEKRNLGSDRQAGKATRHSVCQGISTNSPARWRSNLFRDLRGDLIPVCVPPIG